MGGFLTRRGASLPGGALLRVQFAATRVTSPIICFGQQPCGIFPRRFLYAKIRTARRLQGEIGGEIVFFYHDSDHDPRETITILRDLRSGTEHPDQFQIREQAAASVFSALCQTGPAGMAGADRAATSRTLSRTRWSIASNKVEAKNVADFCLEMYRHLGLARRHERHALGRSRAFAAARSRSMITLST